MFNTHREKTWFNNNLKIGFLAIPKVCSSGIRTQLKLSDENCVNYKNINKDYEKFTVIREPIKRFVSAYLEIILDTSDYRGGRYKHNINLSKDRINFLDELLKSNLSDEDKFVEYLDLIENKWFFYEPHCIPQIYYITDKDNNIQKNLNIFKLEYIDELEKFLNTKLEKHNKCENINLQKKILFYIENNNVIKEKIEKIYSEDIKLYNSFLKLMKT